MNKTALSILTGDTIDDIVHSFEQITHLQGDTSSNKEDALFFYHGNHLSSTQLITNNIGDIAQAILYAPFGQVISEYKQDWMIDTIPRYLFNGKELDEESGLNYYEARYLDSKWGTFNSRDQKFEKYFYISPYAYCANNPVIYIDPDGKEIVTPSKKQAEKLTTDLNKIYKDKYGADDAFQVKETKYTEKVRTNPRTMNPKTWFQKAQYKTVEKTKYTVVGNSNFNWDTDKYTKAMADIMESKKQIRVNIVANNGGLRLPSGVNVKNFVKDLGGGYTYSPYQIYLSDGLSNYKPDTKSEHTLGGVALHELLYHIHSLGAQEKNPNTMRNYYNLKTGNSHPAGSQQSIPKKR